MALVMRYSRICERSSRSSRRLIASHRCTRVSEFAGKRSGFLCRQSGKVYWYVEYSDDELSELPDDIEDTKKYVQIPDKKELDLGKPLVLEFVRQTQRSEMDKVQRIFSAKGAYARFKDLMDRNGVLDQWYNFEAKAEEEALRMWCSLKSIELSD